MCQLTDCKYHTRRPADYECDFMLTMIAHGKTDCRRGCPPGLGCTRYCKGRKMSNNPHDVEKFLNKDKFHERAMSLYSKGKTDAKIAQSMKVQKSRVYMWRKKHHLPENVIEYVCPFDEDRAMALWTAGATEAEMQRVLNTTVYHLRCWKRRRQLHRPHKPPQIKKDVFRIPEDKVRAFYEQGWRDCEIARAIGVGDSTIWSWRQRNNLPPNKPIKKED